MLKYRTLTTYINANSSFNFFRVSVILSLISRKSQASININVDIIVVILIKGVWWMP
jgi:hypothetical protein